MSRPFPMEPFQIKMTAPIRMTTREEREKALIEAGYNLFKLRSRDVMIDLLTDSGTGAMSQTQWGAMLKGDESYAGSESFFRFEAAIQETTGFQYILPTHQGRGAESLFFNVLNVAGKTIPNNTHFDTTRANISVLGGVPVDLPCEDASNLHSDYPFKGNCDLKQLENLLKTESGNIPCILITITNNAVGGQPVSLSNLIAVRKLSKQYGVPLYLDACRFSENVYLAREKEPALKGKTIQEIAKEYFSQADGCLFSAKKDALANTGGFFATNDPLIAETMRAKMVVTEGFPTYGGLAGRDLEAIAVGLKEGLEEDYLAYRIGTIAWLAERLLEKGIPVVTPPGGHAVFINAKKFLPHIPIEEFPGQALACALYLEGGIRSVEIGTFMFVEAARNELVRLAVPHRLYTRGHLEHVIDAFAVIADKSKELKGYKIHKAPQYLRHFTATLTPVNTNRLSNSSCAVPMQTSNAAEYVCGGSITNGK